MWMVDKLLTTENGAVYRGATKEGKKAHFETLASTGMTELHSAEKETLHDTGSLSHAFPSLSYTRVRVGKIEAEKRKLL